MDSYVILLEVGNDTVGLVAQGLSVPVHLILDSGVVAAFEGLGQNACWLALGCSGLKTLGRTVTDDVIVQRSGKFMKGTKSR